MIDSSSLALSTVSEAVSPSRSTSALLSSASDIKHQLSELDSFAAPILSSLDSKIEPVHSLALGSDKDLCNSIVDSPSVCSTDCDTASPASDASISAREKSIPPLASLDIANALPHSQIPSAQLSPLRLRAESNPFSAAPSPSSSSSSRVRKTQSMSALPISSRRSVVPSCAACRVAVPVPMFVKETACQTLSFCSFRCFRAGPKA